MIKKVAQSYQELEEFVKNILFNSEIQIKPELNERILAAKEGISQAKGVIASGDNPFSDENLKNKILGNIDEVTLSRYKEQDLIFSRLNFNISLLDVFDAEDVVINLDGLYSKYESELSKEISSTVTFSEPVTEQEILPDPSEDWYVTSGLNFSPREKVFGPFKSEISAILFSILIHPSGDLLEKTVAQKSDAIRRLQLVDRQINNLNAFDNTGEPVKNLNLAGMVEISSNEIDPANPVKISASGEIFEALVEYLEKNLRLSNSGKNTEEVLNFLNLQNIKNFLVKYIEIKKLISGSESVSSPPGLNNADVVITPAESAKPRVRIVSTEPQKVPVEKKTTTEKPIEVVPHKVERLNIPDSKLPPPKEVSNAFQSIDIKSISIINTESLNLLSDSFISDFILEMREKSESLSGVDKKYIEMSLNSCFGAFRSFFDDCLTKDKEIKKEILRFRESNKFLVNQSWTPRTSAEWEFQNKFSITKRVMEDPVVSKNLQEFFSRLVEAYFFGEHGKVRENISSKVKSYNNRYVLKKDESELENISYEVQASILSEIRKISKNVLKEKINEIVSSSVLDFFNTSNLIDELVLSNIKMSSQIFNKVQEIFQSKENIIDQQSYSTITCGVCGQTTQVPSEYKDELSSFSFIEDQYSFFREDGTLISDSDLGQRPIFLSQETKDILSSIIKKAYSSYQPSDVDKKLFSLLNKGYSWSEVNSLVYDPSSFGSSSEDQILGNVFGQIVRNDILKQFGAIPAGKKGMFASRTLCASSLIKMVESIKQDTRIKKALEEKKNYACLAKIRGNYLPEDMNIPDYQSVAYSNFSGPSPSLSSDISGFQTGYRFSKYVAQCPCHIKSDPLTSQLIKEDSNWMSFANVIAFPNLPENVAEFLSKKDGFEGSKEELYYSPTNPDGSLASKYNDGEQNLSDVSYLICAKKVSISMFDKDPSSINYIRNILQKIIKESGKGSFVSAVKILLDYGIEMNDLKPHVESVLSQNVSVASRNKILSGLFKLSKLSTAQDYSRDLNLIKDLGLICESGHKFTLEQSWRFAQTHSGISLSERRRAKPVKKKTILSLLELDNDSIFKILASSQPDVGLGMLKTNISEEDLRASGFLMPNEIQNIAQYKELLSNKKLYFKSNDGSVYVIGQPMVGYYSDSAWESRSLGFNARTDTKVSAYISGVQSTTGTNEDGAVIEMDIADTSSPSAEEQLDAKLGYSSQVVDLIKKYDLKEVLYSAISEEEISSILDNPAESLSRSKERLKIESENFSNKFIKLLKMSRVFGKMVSDYQIDFLSQTKRTPEPSPNLESNIKDILNKLGSILNIESTRMPDVHERFFNSYDVMGLIERNISYNQFLSLASIAQYYRGFSTPFIANLKDNQAVNVIQQEIIRAVRSNFGYIFNIDENSLGLVVSNDALDNFATSLGIELFSPYKVYDKLDFIKESSIINYTGRAIIFSYAIDVVNGIKSFYARHFFNRSSSLYIGPTSENGMDSLNEMLKTIKSSKDSEAMVPNILIMTDSEFDEKINQLKDELAESYQPTNLFYDYRDTRGIAIPNNPEIDAAYRSIVFVRFSRCLQMASTSLDHLIAGIIIKPLGSRDTFSAAQTLDSSIETIMSQRQMNAPEAYKEQIEEAKQRIVNGRMLFGEAEGVFQKNAVQYGRINLDPDSISFDYKDDNHPAPMIYSRLGYYSFYIDRNYLINGNDYSFKSGKVDEPFLILIKKILMESKGSDYLYIAMVPKDIVISKKSGELDLERKTDLMDLIPASAIRLNTPQGIEFASRYISNIKDFDLSRIILVNSDVKVGKFFSRSQADSAIASSVMERDIFDIRLQKIGEVIAEWPPPNNLLIDNYNVARSLGDTEESLGQSFYRGIKSRFGNRTNEVESYYQDLIGSSKEEFITNLEIFPTSITSRTMIPSSSHGLILPIGGDSVRISKVTHAISRDVGVDIAGMSISNSKVSIPRDGRPPLDISWAFLMNNPQFRDDSGTIKTKLIQSGVVQKLTHISAEITRLFSWFASSGKETLGLVGEALWSEEIPLSSEDSFIRSIFSEDSAFIKLEIDQSLGLIFSYPYSNNIISDYPSDAPVGLDEFLDKLTSLCDFYNASQKLNKRYKELQPLLDSTSAINLAKKSKNKEDKTALGQRALMIRLLDPYSLWMMVNNPAMRANFGGPINSDDVDDYKEFIISTFGLEGFRRSIVEKTGFLDSDIKIDDIFDIHALHKRFVGKSKYKDQLRALVGLFKLQVDENDSLVTHRFNMPVIESSSAALEECLKTIELSEYSVHPSSYLEYPAKLSHSLDDLTDGEIKDILKKADDAAEEVTLRVRAELIASNPELTPEYIKKNFKNDPERLKIELNGLSEKIKRLVSSHPEVVRKKQEFISNSVAIQDSRRRAAAINSGERVLSLDDMFKLSRPDSSSIERPRLLAAEGVRIFRELWTSPTKKFSREISGRKIAQIQTDEDGTIIRSLYDRWWDAYLKIVAKTQN